MRFTLYTVRHFCVTSSNIDRHAFFIGLVTMHTLWVGVTFPFQLPSPYQLKRFVFTVSIIHRYSPSDLLLNTLKTVPRLDLTMHVYHGFPTEPKRRILSGWPADLRKIPPAKMPIPSLLSTHMISLFAVLLDLSLALNSRIHVHACVICI